MAGISRLIKGGGGVEWLGAEIEAKIVEAAIVAIDETTKASADDAKSNHWWSNRTGSLESNVFSEPAKFNGADVTGRFGSSLRKEGFYGLFLERKIPWLRPAADRHNHGLGAKIRGASWR